MVNRPKQIGTAAETAVLKIVKPYFPDAHRLVLAGQQDQGDIWLDNNYLLEVKGGKQAHQVGDKQLHAWMLETQAEVGNASAQHGWLVLQRPGFGAPNADRWWLWTTLGDVMFLLADENPGEVKFSQTLVRFELGDFLRELERAGLTWARPNAA